jgi:hypothetical protein
MRFLDLQENGSGGLITIIIILAAIYKVFGISEILIILCLAKSWRLRRPTQ